MKRTGNRSTSGRAGPDLVVPGQPHMAVGHGTPWCRGPWWPVPPWSRRPQSRTRAPGPLPSPPSAAGALRACPATATRGTSRLPSTTGPIPPAPRPSWTCLRSGTCTRRFHARVDGVGRRPAAGAPAAAVDVLRLGVATRRHARIRLHKAAPYPGRRRHRPAARLRPAVAAGQLAGGRPSWAEVQLRHRAVHYSTGQGATDVRPPRCSPGVMCCRQTAFCSHSASFSAVAWP